MIEIRQVTVASEAIVSDLNTLSSVLHGDERRSTIEDVQSLVADDTAILMGVFDGERIVGMASLYVMQKIGSLTGLIEDVIVDERYRGQKLGEQLVQSIIDEARKRHLKSVSLTSRPERVVAHRLYEKLGFEIKETDVFKLKL